MPSKGLIWFLLFLGSTIGAYVPTLFGAGLLSYWSILGSGIGGLLGIWLAFKIS